MKSTLVVLAIALLFSVRHCLIIPPAAAELLAARFCRTWFWLPAQKNVGENVKRSRKP
jgi:hypothetical protein